MVNVNPQSSLPFIGAITQSLQSFAQTPSEALSSEPGPAFSPTNLQLQTGLEGQANTSLSLQEEVYEIAHTVKRGQSLSEIAKKYLGDSNRYMEIYEANKDQLRNPNDLRIGMTLTIPVDVAIRPRLRPSTLTPPPTTQPERSETSAPSYTSHTVKNGESLSIIALRLLGNSERYMEIFEANRDQLKRPNSIQVGMTLKIPNESGEQTVEESGGPSRIISSIDTTDMTSKALEIFHSLKKYKQHHLQAGNTKRARTTEAEMKTIAIELDKASSAFGVDPKMMLAVFAHESGGFNPRARSHTGAGGLGQLTGIAIRQVHYLAGMGRGQSGKSPYNQHKGNFVQSTRSIRQRYDIKANVWTSTAYMSYELNERKHLGRGVEKALKRYGDPHVSTYANKVNREHQTLFGNRLF